ncbi:ATP-dependent RNA helicase, partial [Tanacetum coccineum]
EPPSERPKGHNSSDEIYETIQLWAQSNELCPKGTIPIRRTTEKIVIRESSLRLVMRQSVDESESKDSWKWFLDCLGDDLELFRNSNFTFISDRQKVGAKKKAIFLLNNLCEVLLNSNLLDA